MEEAAVSVEDAVEILSDPTILCEDDDVDDDDGDFNDSNLSIGLVASFAAIPR